MGRSAILAVKIVGDASGAQKAFSDTERDLNKLSDGFDGLVGPATAVTASIVAGAGFAAKAASDLAESQNKVNVVFGDSAGVINSWAADAASSMGMSTQAALDSAGSFGTLFTQIGFTADEAVGMSTGMTTLAADLASFHNVAGGAAAVTDMMSAAFRGEYDSIQALIPTINAAAVEERALADTGKVSADALTQQERAAATMALVMEGAGPAVGDFAATQDSAANSTRTAQAEFMNAAAALGVALQPVVVAVAGALTELATWITNNTDVMLVIIGVIGTLAAAIVAAKVVMTAWTVAMNVMKVALGLIKVAQIAYTVATNAYAIAAIAAGAASMIAYWPILLIIAAIAAVIAIIVVVVKKWDDIVAAMRKVYDFIKEKFLAVWDKISSAISGVVDWIQSFIDKVGNAISKMGDFIDKINPFKDGLSLFSTMSVVPEGLGAATQSGGSTNVTIQVEGVMDPYRLARLLTRQLQDYAHVQGRGAYEPLAGAW